jgi:hypothetical protein
MLLRLRAHRLLLREALLDRLWCRDWEQQCR